MEIFQTSELSKAITFVRRRLWVIFHEASGLQNQYSLLFLAFRASWLSKAVIMSKENLNLEVFQSSTAPELSKSHTLSKDIFGLVFHHTGGLQNKQSLPLRKFSTFEKRCIMIVFPKRTFTKSAKFTFSLQKIISVCFCNMHA